MDIIYVSAMFDYEIYSRLFTKENKPMHAANKFHRLLCRGLAENGAQVTALSVLPTNRANCDKKFVSVKPRETEGFTQKYVAAFNIPVLRHISLFINTFFATAFAKKGSTVIYDVLVVSASLGATLAAKLTGKKCISIVTDLPQFMPIAQNSKMLKINEFLFDRADGYIFLTKQMDDDTNSEDKPYIVLEGHVDINMQSEEHKPFDDRLRKVLYAGTLKSFYGIGNLCESFARCGFTNAELHIYGDGDYAPKLRELMKKHPNIFYHGNRPNAVVVEHELDCALLVNPRPTEGEYTKYSFPSKTLEYMVSGTPVLTAHLAGIPAEYDDHLYYFDDKTPDGLENALKEILSKPSAELKAKGDTAKQFVLKHKNNVVQAKRVVEFIEKEML